MGVRTAQVSVLAAPHPNQKCGFLLQPQPHIQAKNMNKNTAPKLPNLPCFEAFGVIACPDVCSYFCLVCERISEKKLRRCLAPDQAASLSAHKKDVATRRVAAVHVSLAFEVFS